MASNWMNLLVTILFVTFASSHGKKGCQSWCPGAARPWETKCMWTFACGGCDECAPTTASTTTVTSTTTSTFTTTSTTKKITTVTSTTTTITTVSPKAPTTTTKPPKTSKITPPIITASKTKLGSPTTNLASPTNDGALKSKSKEFTSTFSKTLSTVTILKSTSAPEIEEIASVNKRCNTPKLPSDANTNTNASETAVAIELLAVEIPCPENNARSITSTIKSTSTLSQSMSTTPAKGKDGPKSFWDGLGGDTNDDTLLLMLSTLVGAVIFFLVLIVTVALICSKRRSTVRRTDAISIKLDRKQFDISFSDEGYDDGDDYESDNSSQYSV